MRPVAGLASRRPGGGVVEAAVRKACLATYVHGVTESVALDHIGQSGVPVLRRLLREPSFPRRDNVVAAGEFILGYRNEYDELPELTKDMLARGKVNKGGRPRSSNPRKLISIRLPEEVIQRWRSTGPGWQTRMADRLAEVQPK